MTLETISKTEAARLLKIYRQSERKIKAKLKLALEKGNSTEYIKRVQKDIGREIKSLESQFQDYSQKRLPLIYDKSGIVIDKQIDAFENKFDLENSFGKVDETAMRAIAQNTQASLKGITLQMGRQSAGYLRRIGLMTARDIVVGTETWANAARGMTKQLNDKGFFYVKYNLKNGNVRNVPSAVYSRMVARTTSAEAYRIAITERITGRGYDLVIVLGRSSFPSSPCIPYQGKSLSITGNAKGYIPLEEARAQGFNHPNCLIPDTEVISDGIISSYSRRYEGEVIVINTSSGESLTVTPNHPILTARGWVNAKDITELDEVIKCVDSNIFTSPNNKQVKTVIQKIVSSFCKPSQMVTVSVPTTAKDFHGDVTNQEVCVINSDISLLSELNTVFSEHISKSNFILRHISKIVRVCFSSLDFAFNCINFATSTVISFLCNLFATIIAHKRVSKLHTIALGACPWYAVISEHILNNSKINTEAISDLAFTLAVSKSIKTDLRSNTLVTFGRFKSQKINNFSNSMTRYAETFSEFFSRISNFVITDKVTSVNVKWYNGQVYNLHTLSGFYVANNIITHNCIHTLAFSDDNHKIGRINSQ